MRVTIKVIGAAVTGPAERATEPVAQETNKPMPMDLADGATVKDLVEKAAELGVPKDKISMILLNGEKAEDATPLRDGDAVTMIGQVPGM